VNERFLVFLNDLLATGLVSDLCTPEDIDNFSNSVRTEAKAAGIIETPENLWAFFIEKIRRRVSICTCWFHIASPSPSCGSLHDRLRG
jgi:dynein heavy chain, axonemal